MRARSCVALFLALLISVILPNAASAQEQPAAIGALKGRLLKKGKNTPIAYARIIIRPLDLETRTDESGVFEFKDILIGQYTLDFADSADGQQQLVVTIEENKTTEIAWYVLGDSLLMDEFVVVGEKTPESVARHSLQKDELTSIPGNNNDPIRVVQNLPGAASGGGFGGGGDGLIIRGSGPEDSRYLVNGFEIPQLFHFGVLTSVINPELVNSIEYMPGGYGVKYSDALGGVIEVQSREPRTDRIGGAIDLSTYSSYAMFEGPAGESLSMAGAVRRSFIDFILPYVIPEDQAELTMSPRFYDYQAIVNYDADRRNSLNMMFIGSDDGMELLAKSDDESGFQNSMTMKYRRYFHRGDLRWVSCPNDLFSNSMAFSMLYAVQDQSFGSSAKYQTNALTPALHNETALDLGQYSKLRLGLEAQIESTEISSEMNRPAKEGQPGGQSSSDDARFELNEEFAPIVAGIYLDDAIKPLSWLELIPGVRFDYHSYLDKSSLDPRISLRFFPTPAATISAAAGVYHQWPAQDEMIENIGADDLDPERSVLGALGFAYDFGRGWSIDLQGYYKSLDDLVSTTADGSSEPYANTGVGYVYGFELLGRKKLTDRLLGWVSYTYSVSRRKDSPDDDWRFFDQDQTHNFIVLASYMLGQEKQWKLGAKWQYVSGKPFTEIEGSIYDADSNRYTPIYGAVNAARESDYHQLDIRVDRLWTFNRWTLNAYFDVQNVYYNKSALGYRYNYDYTEKEAITYQSFMPAIGVQVRF